MDSLVVFVLVVFILSFWSGSFASPSPLRKSWPEWIWRGSETTVVPIDGYQAWRPTAFEPESFFLPLSVSWQSTSSTWWVCTSKENYFKKWCWSCLFPYFFPCPGGTFCFGSTASSLSWRQDPTFAESIPFPRASAMVAKIVAAHFSVCHWRYVKWHDIRQITRLTGQCLVTKVVCHPAHLPLCNYYPIHYVFFFLLC